MFTKIISIFTGVLKSKICTNNREHEPPSQNKKRAKLRYLQLAKQGIFLDEIELAGGGQVPALAEDPPMLDLSSRF